MDRKYSWIPDTPDHRDFKYSLNAVVPYPEIYDQRKNDTPVYDQGELGSCTANAIGGSIAFEAKQAKPNNPIIIPSRLFIYYNERKMEGTIKQDAGAMIRDGIKSVASDGVCDESLWPYDISKFTRRPTAPCYTAAKKRKVINYARVPQTEAALKSVISQGNTVVFGFSVYESFETQEVARTGKMVMPSKTEKLLGGHAVLMVGYTKDAYIVRNSWGSGWGDHGYFYMPKDYPINSDLADDFWVITSVS
jgi:C1A family cysteine protease